MKKFFGNEKSFLIALSLNSSCCLYAMEADPVLQQVQKPVSTYQQFAPKSFEEIQECVLKLLDTRTTRDREINTTFVSESYN